MGCRDSAVPKFHVSSVWIDPMCIVTRPSICQKSCNALNRLYGTCNYDLIPVSEEPGTSDRDAFVIDE